MSFVLRAALGIGLVYALSPEAPPADAPPALAELKQACAARPGPCVALAGTLLDGGGALHLARAATRPGAVSADTLGPADRAPAWRGPRRAPS